MEINEKISAIVTGGASGLGEATARMLSSVGANVAIFDLDENKGLAVSEKINSDFYKVDVTDTNSVNQAVSSFLKQNEGIQIVVNCAGIGPAAKTVSRGEPHSSELFAKVININLIGSFNVASICAAEMVKNREYSEDGFRGVIVNTASVAAYDGQIGQVAYSASKGGIVGMTLPMARDLSDKGIRVCSIAPGLFLTPLLESLPEEVQESLGKQVPFPSRLGKPTEFAKLVVQIIENDMLNGEVIRLDGAIRMAPR
ncbi:MAG: 3-hydroxyacyl-CoA dehydrogenase [Rhodobacteraceae bacterium TMED160]|jgi:NAD(P)-dependent dehydrogenase (short-subunit alcohol dehydrogenase family)|nr:MAG: 3-hydroxyacyl-CoA dehydrogenase [Paracoccaceae bacterium]RPF89328.1 MAG: 3-hydroxyacyl-CoA dehydrogenase [Rhodobacteraceae bacterium TMED160]|tara:strand:+ start:8061 stop:8828 length:768 start_codon:yes stop_codon:yes gene_type:complete